MALCLINEEQRQFWLYLLLEEKDWSLYTPVALPPGNELPVPIG
jgi:hypothetical protein